MIRCIAAVLGLCSTIVLADNYMDWPPRNLEGAWRVIRVSEDNPPDNIELAKSELLIVTKDYLILTEAEFPSAYGRQLSDGKPHATGFRANVHIPTIAIDLDGGRKYGMTKETITFAIGKERKATLDVTIDNQGNGLRIHAERIGTDESREKIDRLLADPNFHCDPAKIRELLKLFAKKPESRADG